MAYPPVIPPATRANSTTQLDNHPGDHNAIATALNALPWGPVAAPAFISTATPGITQAWTNVPGLTITATLISGRRYRVLSYLVASVAAAATYVRGRNNSSVSGVLDPAAVPISTVTTTGTALVIVESFIVGAGVAHTITTQAMVDAGTLTLALGSHLTVEDVGR